MPIGCNKKSRMWRTNPQTVALPIMVIVHRATGLAWGVGLISAPRPTCTSDRAHVNDVARRQAHNRLGIWSDGHARHVTVTT